MLPQRTSCIIYTDGERDGLWMACPFRTLVVLYRMFPFIICLILMNYLMEFYFIGFVNAHLPGCFCPWTFRLNIGLNTSPSDSFVSYLNSHLGYSAGEFQALQLIVLAVFGAVDWPLASCMLVHLWNSSLKREWVCKFDTVVILFHYFWVYFTYLNASHYDILFSFTLFSSLNKCFIFCLVLLYSHCI